MKRFLISMAVSITCITIGFTSLFFELHSYEIVDYKEEGQLSSDTLKVADVMRNDRIEIDLDDSYLYVDFQDDLTDDSIIVIDYPANVDMEVNSKKITLFSNYYSSHSYSYRRLRGVLDDFIDGLKDGKIYVDFDGLYSNHIVIHCSSEMRSKIQVDYD